MKVEKELQDSNVLKKYSLIDLLEILEDKNHKNYFIAKIEFSNRKITERELKIARNGLNIRMRAKNRSLNFKEKLNAYLLVFYVSINGFGWTFFKRLNTEFDKQIDEFMDYGELK